MKSPDLARLASLALLVLAGCASTPTLDLGQPGKSLAYVPGRPSFDLEAAPNDAEGGVQISISIPSSSLMFVKVPSGFEAHLQIDVRAVVPRTDTLVGDYAWSDTLFAPTYEESTRDQSWLITRSVRFRSGDVIIIAEILDEATGKREVRSQHLRIPSPNELRPFLGRIILQSLTPAGGWVTIVPMHLPSNLPRLRAMARIFGLRAGVVDTARLTLLRFKYADAIPDPPSYYSQYLQSAGEPRNFWLDSPDTIRSEEQLTNIGDSSVPALSLELAGLPTGLYEIAIDAPVPLGSGRGDTLLTENRVFSVNSPSFPRPSTLRELIDAMTYIMTPKEKNLFAKTKPADAAHHIFDSLWLAFGSTKEQAADLIKRYYTRVEDANKMYTDIKEGWKTDRGMVYVVFGPPQDILNSLDRQIWSYDIPGTSQQVQFVFRRQIVGWGDLSVQTYILYRDASYDYVWERLVARWREGGVR